MTQYQEKIVGKPGGLVEPGVKQYGFFKKIFKPIKKVAKKVWKSPLGKAALIGGGLYGLGGLKSLGGTGIFKGGQGLSRFGNIARMFGSKGKLGDLLYSGKGADRKFSLGKAGLMGLMGAGVTLPFMGGGDEEEEVVDDWPGVGNLRTEARDYYRAATPDYINSPFMVPKEFVKSNYYGADGGLARLANGGQPGEAQAEQMLKMEYQKYRNQGGTMSYQQFKMQVLQQAQARGPMAQGQPQRGGYQGGELVEDASMIEETPTGMMAENVEEVQEEPTREQLEVLAMEIFQLRLEELDEEQLMVVYQAAMEQQPREEEMQEEAVQFAAKGGRMGYAGGQLVAPSADGSRPGYRGLRNLLLENNRMPPPGKFDFLTTTGPLTDNQKEILQNMTEEDWEEADKGGFVDIITDILKTPYIIRGGKDDDWFNKRDGGRIGLANGGVLRSHVPGYTTPPGYNRFDYPSGGVRARRAEGGLMSLGGMEKDYRAEGGFVPIGEYEKKDDVPARLSKNEFVFTADAVRAAGGGDVDAGAEVMANVMNNLESGGEISEESQGAQGMYNNMKQLETRVA